MDDVNWVKLCPYLQFEQPHPLDYDKDIKIKPVVLVYNYFKDKCGDKYLNGFLDHYNKLPSIPRYGQTKLEQVVESINLLNLANKVECDLTMMGLK